MPMFILYFDCADVVGFHIRMSPKVNAIAMICFIFFEQSYVASSGLYADYKKDSQDFSFFYNDVIFFIIYLMNTSNAYGYGKENMCTDYGAE